MIDRSFIPPPKPDVLRQAPEEPPRRVDPARWLTVSIWTALVWAVVCFVLMLLVDRDFGWSAYTSLFMAALFTVIRDRVRRRAPRG